MTEAGRSVSDVGIPRRRGIDVTAALAGACVERAVEVLEHGGNPPRCRAARRIPRRAWCCSVREYHSKPSTRRRGACVRSRGQPSPVRVAAGAECAAAGGTPRRRGSGCRVRAVLLDLQHHLAFKLGRRTPGPRPSGSRCAHSAPPTIMTMKSPSTRHLLPTGFSRWRCSSIYCRS